MPRTNARGRLRSGFCCESTGIISSLLGRAARRFGPPPEAVAGVGVFWCRSRAPKLRHQTALYTAVGAETARRPQDGSDPGVS